MTTAKQPAKPMHPLFLNLPGELRNRIYDLAATTYNETRLVKRTPNSAPSTYAALTRVCRQIREEYLPIQQHNAYLQVYFEELNDFICTFFNEDNPVRFLQIEIRRLHTTPEVEVELLPILRALAKSPSHFECSVLVPPEPPAGSSIDSEWMDIWRLTKGLNTLFATASWPAVLQVALGKIRSFTVNSALKSRITIPRGHGADNPQIMTRVGFRDFMEEFGLMRVIIASHWFRTNLVVWCWDDDESRIADLYVYWSNNRDVLFVHRHAISTLTA